MFFALHSISLSPTDLLLSVFTPLFPPLALQTIQFITLHCVVVQRQWHQSKKNYIIFIIKFKFYTHRPLQLPAVSAFLPLCLLQSISDSLSLCLAFSPSCYEGHQASGDAVPQEESKLASPSLPLFFHNLLFMSDRPPPDKWLPYGERKAEEREGRKNSLCILFLPVDL